MAIKPWIPIDDPMARSPQQQKRLSTFSPSDPSHQRPQRLSSIATEAEASLPLPSSAFSNSKQSRLISPATGCAQILYRNRPFPFCFVLGSGAMAMLLDAGVTCTAAQLSPTTASATTTSSSSPCAVGMRCRSLPVARGLRIGASRTKFSRTKSSSSVRSQRTGIVCEAQETVTGGIFLHIPFSPFSAFFAYQY